VSWGPRDYQAALLGCKVLWPGTGINLTDTMKKAAYVLLKSYRCHCNTKRWSRAMMWSKRGIENQLWSWFGNFAGFIAFTLAVFGHGCRFGWRKIALWALPWSPVMLYWRQST
jgi:hypothetical protein